MLSTVDKTNTREELATELGWSTGKGRGKKGLSIVDKGFEHNTREELATELGWSRADKRPRNKMC